MQDAPYIETNTEAALAQSKLYHAGKRHLDITLSLLALVLLSPVCALVAAVNQAQLCRSGLLQANEVGSSAANLSPSTSSAPCSTTATTMCIRITCRRLSATK